MIEAQELHKLYGPQTALSKASFKVHRGEVVGLLGPNGAGKSTTMKILTCYISPTSGTATVNGCDVFDDPVGARRAIGYLPESTPLYYEMMVLEYLEFLTKAARVRYDAGMSVDEAARDLIHHERFTGLGEAERIVVNVDTLYREFSGAPPRKSAVPCFAAMARYAGKAR